MSKRLLPLALLALPACNALLCDLSRDVEAGIVKGEITLSSGDPARFALVTFANAGLVRQADAEGAFSSSEMPVGAFFIRVTSDVDGDGLADEGGYATAQISVEEHAAGYFGANAPTKTGVDLGALQLTSLTTLRAQIRIVGDGDATERAPAVSDLRAAVAVLRSGCLPQEAASRPGFTCEDGDEDASDHTMSVDGFAAADDDGSVTLGGLVPGAVNVIALVAPRASGPFPVAATALRVITTTIAENGVDLGDVVIDLDSPPEAQDVVLRTTATTAESGYLMLAPRGVPAPPCETTAPALAPPFVVVANLPNGPDHQVRLPLGVFDVTLCLADGTRAFMPDVGIGLDDGVPLFGPLFVGAPLDCVRSIDGSPARDCDEDGIAGLPPLLPGAPDFDDDRALWLSCADACTRTNLTVPDTFGARAIASCTVGGRTFDCDDDGDGQPDVTEPPSCYGPFLGTDHDGDGQCSSEDPFPRCAGNVNCAGTDDFPPPVTALVRGQGGLCDSFVDIPSPGLEACSLEGTGVTRCTAFTTNCYARGCFADTECATDEVCRTSGTDTRCRKTCTPAPDTCAVGNTCVDGGADGFFCVPDAAPAPLLRCYCDDDLFPNEASASFVTEADPSGTCPVDAAPLWEQCVALWIAAGRL
jgi:hypothetical protein